MKREETKVEDLIGAWCVEHNTERNDIADEKTVPTLLWRISVIIGCKQVESQMF